MNEMEVKAQAFKDAVCKMFHQPMEYDRAVVITPFFGHRGLHGYAIAVEGSPAHGTAIIDLSRVNGFVFWFDKMRRIEKPEFGFYRVGTQVYSASIDLLKAIGLPLAAGAQMEPCVIRIVLEKEQ